MKIDEETWNLNIQPKYGHGLKSPGFSHWTIAYAVSRNGIVYYKYIVKIYN
jgi:hypothetical protein